MRVCLGFGFGEPIVAVGCWFTCLLGSGGLGMSLEELLLPKLSTVVLLGLAYVLIIMRMWERDFIFPANPHLVILFFAPL